MTILTNDRINHNAIRQLVKGRDEVQENLDGLEATSELVSTYMGDLKGYSNLHELRRSNRLHKDDSVEVSQMKLQIAVVAAQSSIQTRTDRWNELIQDLRSGKLTPVEVLNNTTDGKIKAEKYSHLVDPQNEILAETTTALRNRNLVEARNYLNGRLTKDTDETYLRTTKSNFVLWLLGYNTHCVDTRVSEVLDNDYGGEMSLAEAVFNTDAGPFRRKDLLNGQQGARIDQKRGFIDGNQHFSEERMPAYFWHDILKWNPPIYDFLTRHLTREVAKCTPIPKDRVSQVMFRTHENEDEQVDDAGIIHEAVKFVADASQLITG